MSRVRVISPRRGLVSYVSERLKPTGVDYSKNLVVFAGRRPAHFLRKRIAERERRPTVPPRILSIEDLIAAIDDVHRASPVRMIDTLDAVAILFELHRKQTQRIGGNHFTDLERFFPLGVKMFGELEELKMAMVTPETVTEQTSIIGHENLFDIAELYESFYRVLERDHLTSRALSYAYAADMFDTRDIDAYEGVIIAGLYALTHSERVLLRAIHECGQSEFVFVDGPGMVKHLEDLDLPYEREKKSGDGPVYRYARAPDLHGQIAALGGVLSESPSQGQHDERSVLVLPRPDALFPVVNHFLPLLKDEGYNISMGYPLDRTPLSGLFNGVAEAVERREESAWFMPDYLRVMLHPYVKNVRFGNKRDVTRILIHTVEEWLAASPGRSMRTLEEIEQSDEIFTRAVLRIGEEDVRADALRKHLRSIHDLLFRSWKNEMALAEFAEVCLQIVRFVHDSTTAAYHPYFRSFSESMIDGLRTLSGSLLATAGPGTLRSSFALLQQVIGTKTVPFPGSPLQGFQVLGLLETRGLSFENVYVLEVNDDVLPGSSVPDQLLPEKVRRSLGMDTHREREAIITYYLSVLFAGAKNVWLAWEDSDGKEKSRFVEKLVWEEERQRHEIRDGFSFPAVHYGLSLAAETPSSLPKTQEESAAIGRRSVSAGALDTYLRCQIRYYYRYVLGLSSPDDLSGKVEQADIGNLVHAILQKFFGSFGTDEPLPNGLKADDMRAMAETMFDETFGPSSTASALLMRERVSDQLGRFISSYQNPLLERSQVRIISLEEKIEGMIGDARFRVRTDRIEQRRQKSGKKTYHILDYKTGGDPGRLSVSFDRLDIDDRSTWRDAVGSFQLFLYVLLFARSQNIDPATVNASYLLLGRQPVDESIERGIFDSDGSDTSEKLESLEKIVRMLTQEMKDPGASYAPTSKPEHDCPGCPFTTLCGTSWTERRGGW